MKWLMTCIALHLQCVGMGVRGLEGLPVDSSLALPINELLQLLNSMFFPVFSHLLWFFYHKI